MSRVPARCDLPCERSGIEYGFHLIAELTVGHDDPDSRFLSGTQFFDLDVRPIGDQFGIGASFLTDRDNVCGEPTACGEIQDHMGDAFGVLAGQLAAHAKFETRAFRRRLDP